MRLFLALLLCLLSAPLAAQERIVRLAAIEWEPYSDAHAPQQGTVTETLKRAYAAVGHTLAVEFQPRKQAFKVLARAHASMQGVFPVVYSPANERQWQLSEPVGASALGFAQKTDRSIYWSTLDDIEALRLGVVQDAVNGELLDLRLELGTLKAETQASEVALLIRLGSGKIDLAAIDSLVFAHLISNDARLTKLRSQLIMNPRQVEQRSLHVAFRRNAEGRRQAALLAEGLRRIGLTTPVFTSFAQ